MTPVQQRVIRALDGEPFEDQLASLGFAMVFLLNTACSSPLEEFERLADLMRTMLVQSQDLPDGKVQ